MKFAYPDLSTIEEHGLRLYVTPSGQYYPSITTVLSGTQSAEKTAALDRWRASLGADAESISKAITDKGTHVHLMAERYLQGITPFSTDDGFSKEAIESFNGLKLKLSKIEEVWGQEVALFSDALTIAGRCDCVAVYKGKECIIDFKTSSRIKTKEMIDDYKLQLCAYAQMHNEMFGTKIMQGVVLMSSMNGFPQEFTFDLTEAVAPLKSKIAAFYAQLSVKLA